jgi:tRNA G18 (ribose-2'-O)-methylase SpoU
MRGYFAIGIEGVSKTMNAGNLFRSAHAFGATFVFTVAADPRVQKSRADTSRTPEHLPWYDYASVADLTLPSGCQLVGVELLDNAIELPSFRHPPRAAYVFGPERGALSPALLARCDHRVKIPTSFCINLATAGAVIMYDRLLTLGRFAERPLSQRAEPLPQPDHVHGGPRRRRGKK